MSHKPCKLGFISQFHFRYKNKRGTLGSFFAPLALSARAPGTHHLPYPWPCKARHCKSSQRASGQKGKGPKGHWVSGSEPLVGGELVMLFSTGQRESIGTEHFCDSHIWQKREQQPWDPQCVWTSHSFVLVAFNTSLLLSTIQLSAPSYRQRGCLTAAVPA